MTIYIFFLQWGTRSKSHMPTWFNKWEAKKRKLKTIKSPPHALMLDLTQKKPKGVGILGRGLKKENKQRARQLNGGLTLRINPTTQPPCHHFLNEHCSLTLLGKPHVCSARIYILQVDYYENELRNVHSIVRTLGTTKNVKTFLNQN